jgi:hypothetical protein
MNSKVQSAPLDRRDFLKIAGLGAGTLALAGVGGLTWRAVDGGVFATGTGPAYAAWDALSPSGQDCLGLVRAAVLAANAYNTQPWHFRVATDRIDLFADTSRSFGTMDPLGREMQISLGCAIENLALAGPANGKAPTVRLRPDPSAPTHIARVDLVPTKTSASALFAAIPNRHTNRAAYDLERPVTQGQLDALGSLVDTPDVQLVWFTKAADKRTFGDLTTRATRAIIADPQQAADDFAWYRTDWDEIQAKKDGITIDPSGQSTLIRALAKVLPVSRKQNNDGWLRGTLETQIPTAAAFGALVVRDPLRPTARLGVGRIWQRIHLSATVKGLADAAPVPGSRAHRPGALCPSGARLHRRHGGDAPCALARDHDIPHRLPHQPSPAQPPPSRHRGCPDLTQGGRSPRTREAARGDETMGRLLILRQPS